MLPCLFWYSRKSPVCNCGKHHAHPQGKSSSSHLVYQSRFCSSTLATSLSSCFRSKRVRTWDKKSTPRVEFRNKNQQTQQNVVPVRFTALLKRGMLPCVTRDGMDFSMVAPSRCCCAHLCWLPLDWLKRACRECRNN